MVLEDSSRSGRFLSRPGAPGIPIVLSHRGCYFMVAERSAAFVLRRPHASHATAREGCSLSWVARSADPVGRPAQADHQQLLSEV
jgi:hypothetical protein